MHKNIYKKMHQNFSHIIQLNFCHLNSSQKTKENEQKSLIKTKKSAHQKLIKSFSGVRHLFGLQCYSLMLWKCFIIVSLIDPLIADRHGPFFIREPPHNVDFSNSTGEILTCIANGNPTPDIKWQTEDGIPVNEIPGLLHIRSDNSLVFSPFRAEYYRQSIHSNVYQCVASNSVGSIVSRTVNLRSVILQHFMVEVYDEFVILGNTAVLRCHIPGFIKEFVSVVSWIQDSTSIIQATDLPGDRYSIFPTGELHVRRVQQSDAMKNYRCHVRHKLTGETILSQTSGRLFVTESFSNLPPRITDSKPVVMVQQGSSTELPCAGQGFPVPNYIWTHNSIPLSSSLSSHNDLLHPNRRFLQIDGSLRIRSVLLSDSGLYRCTINNSVGSEMIETQLIVTAPLSAEIIPRLQTVDVGKSTAFNCTVNGGPLTYIKWLRNGLPIMINSRVRLPSRDTLYLQNVERKDRGMYQCIVGNDWDSAQSATQLELADDPPLFIQTFDDQTLQSGPPISLKCVASGNPIPQVTWQIFGTLSVPDNSRYRTGDYVTRDGLLVSYVNISSITADDSGIYTCTAANDVSFIKHSARINVYGPPSVRIMPNVTAVAGDTMTITCPVGGYPIDSITWERENVRLPFNHRQKVYPNGTITVTDIERSTDEGRYTCIARQNKEGRSAQQNIHVIVLIRPVIDPFVFPKSLHQGQRYNVLCSVVRGDPPVNIQWLKDGEPISGANLKEIDVIHVTKYSATLAFESVQPEHRGNYTCVASNLAGRASQSASMVIHVPPRWRIEPIDASVVKGRTAVIDCDADAYPPPRTHWSRAEGIIREPPTEFKPISSNAHLRPYENGSLAIHNAQKPDSGYYMCQASNGIGTGLSKVIKLTVHVAAHFEVKFRAETVRKGQEAKVRCDAIGDKPITIAWLKDKMAFNPRDDPRYELTETIVNDGIKSEMIIRTADRRDSALFSCVTSNTFGHDDTNIQLIMQEPPDCPQDVKVKEHDARSAKIFWSPPYSGNSPIINYIVQYKLDSDKWSPHNSNLTVAPSETMALIRGLRPITYYQLRISAVNSLGMSEPSEVIDLKTDEETPGGPPLHIKAMPMSSKSIKVNWKQPHKDLQYGVIRGYYVGYKSQLTPQVESQRLKNDFVYKTLEVRDHSSVEECTLTGLKRSTKYFIIVQAFNSKGAGPASEPINAKTLDLDPPSAPTLRIMSTTTNSIELSWQINVEDETPATDLISDILGFILHHKKESEDWDELRMPIDSGTSRRLSSHTHKWLKCGSRYQFYMTAYNSVGKSEPSSIVSTKTDGFAPVAPDKHSLLHVNATSVTVYLDAINDGGCPILMFDVMYKLQRSKKWTTLLNGHRMTLLSETPENQKQIVLNDLEPATVYDLKITSYNEAGSTEAQYSFSTSPIVIHDEQSSVLLGSKSSSSVPIYADFNVIIPTTVTLIVVILLVTLVWTLFIKKTEENSNIYRNYGVHKPSHSTPETVRLTELNTSHAKKISHEQLNNCNASVIDSGYFPSPYAMTKIIAESADHENCSVNIMPQRLSPLKSYNPDNEPLYATVKRTPRSHRSDMHIYQCPINGNSEAISESSSQCQWRNSSAFGPLTPEDQNDTPETCAHQSAYSRYQRVCRNF